MALQFVFGGSGAGKSTFVQEYLIDEAKAHVDRQYLLIVPDQFTLDTQKQMVTRHPDGGIINIDVLSFSRLCYRIFSEVGQKKYTLLDDTGKCLLIRKIADEVKKDLKVLNKGISNPGWTENVKASLSEFMQYGIKPEALAKIIEKTENISLKNKLEDLHIIYEKFLEKCQDKYETKESVLEVLSDRIPMSKIIKDSTIVFDGFTGFTPIQVAVVETLLVNASKVMITLPISKDYDPYGEDGEEGLFYLTQKTVRILQQISEANNLPLLEDIYLPVSDTIYPRFIKNPELSALESNLYRLKQEQYPEKPQNIRIMESGSIDLECRSVCKEIYNLVTKEGMRYRDIAIITGDMNMYAGYLARCFANYDIPYYMDANREALSNAFIQFLRSTLAVLSKGYKREDMFNFLRLGFTKYVIRDYEVEALENYCIARNITGRTRWAKPFDKYTRFYKKPTAAQLASPNYFDPLDSLNKTRQSIVDILEPFYIDGKLASRTVKEWLIAMYSFMDNLKLEYSLETQAKEFEEAGETVLAKEYSSIYDKVITLMEQIASLLPDEKMTIKEFSDCLDAGYKEIRLGIVPKAIDLVTVGDNRRTRLGEIKALFFMGVNDGLVPAVAKGGGILSTLDKLNLSELGVELSPMTREQAFSEHLYLYMNVTKPTEKLFISYSLKDNKSKAMFPSSFIYSIKEVFPKIQTENIGEDYKLNIKDYKNEAGKLIGKYASGDLLDSEYELLVEDLAVLQAENEGEWINATLNRAFGGYVPKPLSKAVVEGLFTVVETDAETGVERLVYNCSVSSLEQFSGCHFKHFLSYGLRLTERENYDLQVNEKGTIFHKIMQDVLEDVRDNSLNLSKMTEEDKKALVEKYVTEETADYNEGMLTENAINQFFAEQLKRRALFELEVIGIHLARSRVKPKYFEKTIQEEYPVTIGGKEYTVRYRGNVDRTDIYVDETNKKVYVKIVDYKSSGKSIETPKVEKGLQMQLPLYLGVLCKELQKEYPEYEVIPTAALYMNLSDGFYRETKSAETDASVLTARINSYAPTGIGNAEEMSVVDALWGQESSKDQLVLPINSRKVNTFKSGSVLLGNTQELNDYIDGVKQTADEVAVNVLSGGIEIKPNKFVEGSVKNDPCEYCAYKTVCGFDSKIEGFEEGE